MTPARWHRVKEVFEAALECDPGGRGKFLSEACGTDRELYREVQALLTAHDKDGSFLDSPAFEHAAEYLAADKPLMQPGQQIGSYEIVSFISRGGMGEVYVAEDRRLNRRVALKLLLDPFTRDKDRLRRFEQEARAASALNHPNIITIYEIFKTGSTDAIVAEYVEGETLRDRLLRSPLTLPESVSVAIQVADALVAAHQAGIIHRDIKPENIMQRPDGYVKVLDFGLAKLTDGPLTVDHDAPTKRVKTGSGVIIGTVGYMSPEQARGQSVDARTDVFSLGALIYEMVAHHKPFSGETPSDTLAAILKTDPEPLSHFVPDAPAELERIVGKALRKNREERYQVVKDLVLDLKALKEELDFQIKLRRSVPSIKIDEVATHEGISQTTDDAASSSQLKTAVSTLGHSLSTEIKRHKTSVTVVGVAVVVTVMIGGFALYKFLKRSLSPTTAHTPTVVATSQITFSPGLDVFPSISPDGNSIAYASDHDGSFEIYVLPMTAGGREIQLTNDGQQNLQPKFSPDGKLIVFCSRNRGGIWTIPASGGKVKQLSSFGSYPSWSPDGTLIAFQSAPIVDLGAQATPGQPPSTIWVVPSDGSAEPTTMTGVSNPAGGHGAPAWSPDGKRIVFCATDFGSSSIWTVTNKGDDPKQIFSRATAFDPAYAPDGESIYFSTLSGLWQIRVAATSGEPIGEPIKITGGSAERVRHFSISADGKKIAYSALLTNSNIWSLTLATDLNSTSRPPVALTHDKALRHALAAFSPDGKRIAFNTQNVSREGTGDIWVMDADGKNATQVTTEGGGVASWFPDGEQLLFLSSRDPGKAFIANLKTGQERDFLEFGERVNYQRLSPDGKQVAFNSKRSGSANVWTIPTTAGAAKQLTFDKEFVGYGFWAPDSKTLGVQILRSGDTHLGVMPSEGGEITQLTFEPGQSWNGSFSPNGDKIIFAGFRNGLWNLYWVSRSTRQQKQITNYTKLNSYVRYPAWSPVGNQIAYEYTETTGNIWMIELK